MIVYVLCVLDGCLTRCTYLALRIGLRLLKALCNIGINLSGCTPKSRLADSVTCTHVNFVYCLKLGYVIRGRYFI